MLDLTDVLMIIAMVLFIVAGTSDLSWLTSRRVRLGWLGLAFLTAALYTIQAG